MAYTTQQAVNTLNGYLGISNDKKEYIEGTKNRGFVLTLDSGEKIVIFVYPLVHKQDNTKNYFDTRDSGAYERGVAWNYALRNGMKYFCFGVNNQVDKYNDYVFSLECNEAIIEKISGTKDGSRNGPGNQIIIPNDYAPQDRFERIRNRLGIYISAIRKDALFDYLSLYDNRPYLAEQREMVQCNDGNEYQRADQIMMELEQITCDEEDQEERNKKLFRCWMEMQVKPEGDSNAGEPYSNDSINSYVSNIANTPLPMMSERSVFFTTEIAQVQTAIEVLDTSEKKNNTQRSAIKKYLQYLIATQEGYMPLIFNTDVDTKNYERNRIIFGAPGTGKSYGLKGDSEKLLAETVGTYERVTFHPDYSYSQFVGTYKPVMDEDGKSIRYDFVPGPFMRVYVDALKSGRTDAPQPHLLLIEEINRAKVAAVFGDVFQLLDRDDDGVSEYEIQASEDIRRFLAKELGGTTENYKKIRIPNNMFIWATMNSADQGVFPMDTAFKRRWNFEYLGINKNEEGIVGIGKILLPGSDEPVEWNMLRKSINAKMSSDEFKINEDKLMGPFFLSKKMIASDENGMIMDTEKFIDVFKSKVIMYLYEDAVKQGKRRFFDGCDSGRYSSVCESFDEIGIGIFGSNFVEKFWGK